MSSKEFGKRVRALRLDRRFINKQEQIQQWTQAHLGELLGISERRIGAIERGEVDIDFEIISQFVRVFQLGTEAAEELYRSANYVPPTADTPARIDKSMVKRVFMKLNYPASARTFLWDFIAFNNYHFEVFGHTPETISALKANDVLGPNLLRVFFDPLFNHAFKVGGKEKWRQDVVRNLRIFQSKTNKYSNTKRYKEIVTEMENYPLFRELWDEARNSDFHDDDLQHPITHVHTRRFGHIEFVSLRIHKYLEEDMDVSVYVPVSKYEGSYRQLQETIIREKTKESVYFFDGLPVR